MQDGGGGCMRSLLGSRELGRERLWRVEEREERERGRRVEKREDNSSEYVPGGIFIRFDGTPDSVSQVRSTCSKVVWTEACHPTN